MKFASKFFSRVKDIITKTSRGKRCFVLLYGLVIVLLVLVVGAGYGVFKFSFLGNFSSLTTNSLELKLLESNSDVIDLKNVFPMPDKIGKKQTDTFDFAVITRADSYIYMMYDIKIEKLIVDTGYTELDDSEIKVYLTDYNNNEIVSPTRVSDLNDYVLYTTINKHSDTRTEITNKYKLRLWIDNSVNAFNWDENTKLEYKFKIGVSSKRMRDLDTSGASEPELDSQSMIPVYYDGNVWRKADSTNTRKNYQWYDYDNKMWANSVTVSSSTRSNYLNASLGTEIDKDDILTMQVWIPRFKYKVWNYNMNGTVGSSSREVEIVWEDGVNKTGDITCVDSLSGTDGSASEVCKIDNTLCTNSTCNNRMYTHPAFTFGNEEISGFWMGKFEVSVSTSDACYEYASEDNCNELGKNLFVKPDVMSYRYASVGTYETSIMAMNDSNNIYGFDNSIDTHVIKNSEWGAVVLLSNSKYGTCNNGNCSEVYINNSSSYYTGRSGGNVGGSTPINGTYTNQSLADQYNSYGYYTYDGYLLEYGTNKKSSTKDISKIASSTKNIYGVYDMSGGAWDYVVGNMVSSDGESLISGSSLTDNSGYTGLLYNSGNYTSYTGSYAYPDNKYIDKYSFGSSASLRIKTKLGDAIKEVYAGSNGWYGDSLNIIYSSASWFCRGGDFDNGSIAGIFSSGNSFGYPSRNGSTRLIIVS